MKGTGVPEAVDTDLSNIHQEYTDIVLPFMIRHPDLWNPETHTLELYTQLVAFVMAYRSACKFLNLFCFYSFVTLSVLLVASRSQRKKIMKKMRRPPILR